MKHEYHSKQNEGISLVETIVALAIGLIIVAAVSITFLSQKKAYDVQAQVSEMHQNARAAMDMISGDIASAGYDPTNAGFVGIPYDSTQLELVADLNGDGDTLDNNEDIIYAFDSSSSVINRTAGGNTDVLAENIQAFNFRYYDADGNETTDSAAIRKIAIDITARTSQPDSSFPANSGYRTRTLSSEIIPRNLAQNIIVSPTLAPTSTTTLPPSSTTTTAPPSTISTTSTTSTTELSTTSTDSTTSTTETTIPDVDVEPPTVKILPNEEFTLCAQIISSVGIESVELYYSLDDIAALPVLMTPEGGDVYCTVIAGQKNATVVTYYVAAKDSAGSTGVSDTVTFIVGLDPI